MVSTEWGACENLSSRGGVSTRVDGNEDMTTRVEVSSLGGGLEWSESVVIGLTTLILQGGAVSHRFSVPDLVVAVR
jgi:hypothetical protein